MDIIGKTTDSPFLLLLYIFMKNVFCLHSILNASSLFNLPFTCFHFDLLSYTCIHVSHKSSVFYGLKPSLYAVGGNSWRHHWFCSVLRFGLKRFEFYSRLLFLRLTRSVEFRLMDQNKRHFSKTVQSQRKSFSHHPQTKLANKLRVIESLILI